MSEIDGMDNSNVGMAFYIPLYHVMRTKYNEKSFPYNVDSWWLGGGSGEHSAFIVYDTDDIAAFYIDCRNGNNPIDYPNYELYWTIEECASAWPKISAYMEAMNINNTAENGIILAIGDFICNHARPLIKDESIRKGAENIKNFFHEVEPCEPEEAYGRFLYGNNIKWGVTLENDINYTREYEGHV